MKLKTKIRSWAAALAIIFAVTISNELIFAALPASVKFSAILDKKEYTSEEPINVTFNLKNTGNQPTFVNKRFYISSPSSPKDQKEVYFTLISPSGAEITCKYSYETGLPKSEYFQLLQPKEEIKSEYPRNLRGFYEIKEPGIYKLTAVYQNACGAELGLDVFKEKLTAETVSFKVIEKK